jgi:hypothetical protein
MSNVITRTHVTNILVAPKHALFNNNDENFQAYLSSPKDIPGVPIDRYVLYIFCMISISSSAVIGSCESIKPLRPAESQLISDIMSVIIV